MEEIIKIQMGTCACHDKENEKPRRMRKLKSSKLKKELQADRLLRDVVDKLFVQFDKDKDDYLDSL